MLVPFIIIVVMIFRFRKIMSGGKVNKNKIISSIVLSIGFSFFAVFSSFQIGVPIDYLFVYMGLLAGSAYLTYRLIEKSIIIWKAGDGSAHAKGGFLSYLIWFAGLAARFVLGYLYLGSNFLSVYGTHKALSASAVEITLIIDMIMMVGIGTVTGRNIRILSSLKNFQTKNKP